MDMAVDSAGQDQQARSVDLGSGARKILRQRDDTAVFDAHVAFAHVGGGDDRSAANDQIKLHSHYLCFHLRRFRPRRRKIHAICADGEAGCKMTPEPA
jgi:hypothetical protein